MSEQEFNEWFFRGCRDWALAEIESYSAPWELGGPSKKTAEAIINHLKSRPIPLFKGDQK